MSDKRKEKMDRLIQKRDAYRNKDFKKLDELNGKPHKVMTMNDVLFDAVLAVFFTLTVIGVPLGLFFAVTAIFKYSLVRKERKEPRA